MVLRSPETMAPEPGRAPRQATEASLPPTPSVTAEPPPTAPDEWIEVVPMVLRPSPTGSGVSVPPAPVEPSAPPAEWRDVSPPSPARPALPVEAEPKSEVPTVPPRLVAAPVAAPAPPYRSTSDAPSNVVDDEPVVAPRPAGRLWWLAVAALLLLVGLVAVMQIDWIESAPVAAPTRPVVAERSPPAPSQPVETAVFEEPAEPPLAAALPEPDIDQSVVTVPRPEPAPVEPAPVDPVPVAEPEPAIVASPSYNCRRARSRVEKLICGSEPLAALDREMAALFYGIVAEADSATVSAVQRSRDDFLARRDRCPDAACVTEVYQDRIDGLARLGFPPRPE